jgi:hypothetical protein
VNLHQAYQIVLKAYGNSSAKAMEWFNTPLREFKYKSANDLIEKKQIKKVLDYVSRNF